ncbi:hypothetical protein HDU96_010363 [Phlyctochytrium bullatum]|nr:hypothetical protein HDU96_010363 [Phlyctochytrium bullatum]
MADWNDRPTPATTPPPPSYSQLQDMQAADRARHPSSRIPQHDLKDAMMAMESGAAHHRRRRERKKSLPLLKTDGAAAHHGSSREKAGSFAEGQLDFGLMGAGKMADPKQLDSMMKRISATQQQLAAMMEDLKQVARTVSSTASTPLSHRASMHVPITPSTTPPVSGSRISPRRPSTPGFDDDFADHPHPPPAPTPRRLSMSSTASASASLPTRPSTPGGGALGGTVFVDPDDEVTMSPRAVAAPVTPWSVDGRRKGSGRRGRAATGSARSSSGDVFARFVAKHSRRGHTEHDSESAEEEWEHDGHHHDEAWWGESRRSHRRDVGYSDDEEDVGHRRPRRHARPLSAAMIHSRGYDEDDDDRVHRRVDGWRYAVAAGRSVDDALLPGSKKRGAVPAHSAGVAVAGGVDLARSRSLGNLRVSPRRGPAGSVETQAATHGRPHHHLRTPAGTERYGRMSRSPSASLPGSASGSPHRRRRRRSTSRGSVLSAASLRRREWDDASDDDDDEAVEVMPRGGGGASSSDADDDSRIRGWEGLAVDEGLAALASAAAHPRARSSGRRPGSAMSSSRRPRSSSSRRPTPAVEDPHPAEEDPATSDGGVETEMERARERAVTRRREIREREKEAERFDESFDKVSTMLQSLILEAKVAVGRPAPLLDLSSSASDGEEGSSEVAVGVPMDRRGSVGKVGVRGGVATASANAAPVLSLAAAGRSLSQSSTSSTTSSSARRGLAAEAVDPRTRRNSADVEPVPAAAAAGDALPPATSRPRLSSKLRRRAGAAAAAALHGTTSRGHIRPLVVDPSSGAPEPRFDDERRDLFTWRPSPAHSFLRQGAGGSPASAAAGASPLRHAWGGAESAVAAVVAPRHRLPLDIDLRMARAAAAAAEPWTPEVAGGTFSPASPFCSTSMPGSFPGSPAADAAKLEEADEEGDVFHAAEAGASTDEEMEVVPEIILPPPAPRKTAHFGPTIENVSDDEGVGAGRSERSGSPEDEDEEEGVRTGAVSRASRASSVSEAGSAGSSSSASSASGAILEKVSKLAGGRREDAVAGPVPEGLREGIGAGSPADPVRNVAVNAPGGASALLLVNLQVSFLVIMATSAMTFARSAFGGNTGSTPIITGAADTESGAGEQGKGKGNGKGKGRDGK